MKKKERRTVALYSPRSTVVVTIDLARGLSDCGAIFLAHGERTVVTPAVDRDGNLVSLVSVVYRDVLVLIGGHVCGRYWSLKGSAVHRTRRFSRKHSYACPHLKHV